MAPRHLEICPSHRNRMQEHEEPSFPAFDDKFFEQSETAFDPFNTSEFDDDFNDSFSADFDDVAFPVPDARSHSGSKASTSSKQPVRKSRSKREDVSRMDESSHREDASGRLEDSKGRMGDSSRRMGDSSRRKPRNRDEPTPKPKASPSFPKNTRRVSLEARPAAGSRAPKRPSAPPHSPTRERPTRPSTTGSKSRRSTSAAVEEEKANDSPRSPDSSKRTTSIRASAAARSPRPSRRESTGVAAISGGGATDARSRIRKEAALQREQKQRELREQEEEKLAKQKAKLSRLKSKTDELLGKKLADLDSKNGDTATETTTEDDAKSMGSKSRRELASGSQGRRRRTHLSHNILVRNMNQIMAPQLEEVEDHSEEYEETGAWLKRRERQRVTS